MKTLSRATGICIAVLSIYATDPLAQTFRAVDSSTSTMPSSRHRNSRGPSSQIAALPDATVFPAADGSEQADALQQTLDQLQAGQRLVFAPGRYVVGHSLVVKGQQVVVSGYGATLVATNPEDQTIVMSGSNSTLVGLTLIGTGTTRLTTPGSTKVEVTGAGIQVLDVTIQGGASDGIFVFGGTDIAVVGNKVQGTLADGIHTTYGSHNVLVQDNTVTGTGDDMIAVVSYQGDGASVASAPARKWTNTGRKEAAAYKSLRECIQFPADARVGKHGISSRMPVLPHTQYLRLVILLTWALQGDRHVGLCR
ncbi:hypothetical protein LMG28614_03515 [Paraburkholderia ultramafica]|uniref:Right handed beta helix domain-containing protein n=1 Tax=Paraburkholderia ultramafica TaxID=1544867 RepID=A0A6S7BA74_9BURK|nr:hypothetical protein LMG28614_03515 [Paraburkholderia ultramafica]